MQNLTIRVAGWGIEVRLVNKWVGWEIYDIYKIYEIYERYMNIIGVGGKIFETFIDI